MKAGRPSTRRGCRACLFDVNNAVAAPSPDFQPGRADQPGLSLEFSPAGTGEFCAADGFGFSLERGVCGAPVVRGLYIQEHGGLFHYADPGGHDDDAE